MTIYLDAVWALNFFLDMMLLMLTQALVRDDTRKLRIMFGALIASLIVPISLYYPNSLINTLFGKLVYSILIVFCAFRFHSIYRLIKQLLLFYFITFSVGGALIAVHFLFQNSITMSLNGLLTLNSGYGDPVSWLFVICGFPLAWFFTKKRMDQHAIEKIRYDQLCPVTIEIFKKVFSTTGYIDSGNQLVDPMTKYPVIICDELFIKQWFSTSEWTTLKAAQEELNLQKIPTKWEQRIHIVPYQGVEGKTSFLLAIRPDKLTIFYEGHQIDTTKILIGLQFATLTKDQSYHCLLHPQIIKLSSAATA